MDKITCTANQCLPLTDAMCVDDSPSDVGLSTPLSHTGTTLTQPVTNSTSGTPVFYTYFISTEESIRPYFIKLPSLFSDALFMDGMCDLVHPPTVFTFPSFCVVRLVFTYKNHQCHFTDSGLHHYLEQAQNWFTTIDRWHTHLPSALLPNVDTFFCASELTQIKSDNNGEPPWYSGVQSALSALHQLQNLHPNFIYLWNRTTTLSYISTNDSHISHENTESSIDDTSRHLKKRRCLTPCESPTRAQQPLPVLILLYRDLCRTPLLDAVTRFKSLTRTHVEFQSRQIIQTQELPKPPAFPELGSATLPPADDIELQHGDCDLVQKMQETVLDAIDEKTDRVYLPATTTSPESEFVTSLDAMADPPHFEKTPETDAALQVPTSEIVARIEIRMGDFIVYLNPDTCDFVMQQVIGFEDNELFWLVLKEHPPNAHELNADTVVALFNDVSGELSSALQPLHKFTHALIDTK